MAELQHQWLAAPESAAQGESEESRRIRLAATECRPVCTGYLNVPNRQLFLRIIVRAEDRASDGYWLCPVNSDRHRYHTTRDTCDGKSPDRNLSFPGHSVPTINIL